jgi:hypothetical protein
VEQLKGFHPTSDWVSLGGGFISQSGIDRKTNFEKFFTKPGRAHGTASEPIAYVIG